MFSVCWKLAKGKITQKSKTSTVIIPKYYSQDWFEINGIEKKTKVILFKKVSQDWKTQEGTKNETVWEVGKVLTHRSWEPKNGECGEGKYHACSRPYFCDEFRNETGDRYIAIEMKVKDTHAWENPCYPHKIAFREGKVLYEVNRLGKKI